VVGTGVDPVTSRFSGRTKSPSEYTIRNVGWRNWRNKRKEKKASRATVIDNSLVTETSSLTSQIGDPPVGVAPAAKGHPSPAPPGVAVLHQLPKKEARRLQRRLQAGLGRPVKIEGEGVIANFVRDRSVVQIALTAGAATAAVLVTGGVAGGLLLALAPALAAGMVLDGSTRFQNWDPGGKNVVRLDSLAASFLVQSSSDDAEQVKILLRAVDGKPGSVTITQADLAKAKRDLVQTTGNTEPTSLSVGLLPGIGAALIAAGLILLALTLIPDDVAGLPTRAAIILLIVGGLLIVWLGYLDYLKRRTPAISQ
jgi:hypothetical protein